MKKKLLIFTITFTTLVFVSCRKQNAEIEQPTSEDPQSITTPSIGFDSLMINLEGRFEFDGNLKDLMSKLPDGTTTNRLNPIFTADRKGRENRALKLNGFYGVNIKNVPQQTHTSLSVWLNIPDRPYDYHGKGIVFGRGPFLTDEFVSEGFGYDHETVGGIITGYDSVQNMNLGTFTAAPYESGWHHYVLTYDGSYFHYYYDADPKFIIPKNYGASILSQKQNYMLGFYDLLEAATNGFWKGSMDDLRFYSRTLTESDVKRLYKQ
jgi:hypothetical protein